MTAAAAGFGKIEVVAIPVKYPMGSERHLTLAVTGRETPARKLTADIGVVVHNVSTARAVHQAVRHGRPLVARVVTVSGGAVREPKNIEAPIGARVADLIDFCGGLSQLPERMVLGGPMMGAPLPAPDVPVVKGTSGILALTAAEINDRPADPCIRCGACVSICACGLVPVELAAHIRNDDMEGAASLGVMDCVSCGSCSWVCPSHIPLVHYFNYAKGLLNAQDREHRKSERTRTLVEAHTARLERAAAQRAATLARKPKAAPAGEASA
jgi:electron transport complex protein RnfC